MRAAALALLFAAAAAATPASARAEAAPPPPLPYATPVRLFAAAEEAWSSSNADLLAGLVDTTSVRISLKPGAPLTEATTRSAAAFLFQDQLRLVATQSFQVFSISVDKTSASAAARWDGDWGGRLGVRRLTVRMRAVPVGGRWCLREVRVKG
ncbi:MAG TPA: hypothetical protein VK123_08665 [Candidatus Limnocylindrales bacterium]|nr:hypothetical protein [Candidatus Limnocylindrales bacterium]